MPSGRATAPGPAQSQSKAKKGANTATLPRIPLLVDAVTFDEAGRLVRDLTAADFGVSVRGEAKKIVSVNYVNSIAGTIAPVSTTLALTPDRIHRTLVLIADDLGLSADGADNLRRTLTRFLDEQMRPSDMVSILRTASGSGNHPELTSDRSELAAAAAGIHYN
ncbi:MAG TPA: hypothetical protein VGS58_21185, partial [Candidatus Sulfopaludibacter sp.]|nr:hypothetical protein [Candidatus Sulfopaludibacter sp.]